MQRNALLEVGVVVNGRWWEDIPTHYCTHPSCCRLPLTGDCYSRAVCVAKTQHALRRSMFRVLPAIPSAMKWSKLGPCLDYFLSVNLANGLYRHVYKNGFQEFHQTLKQSAERVERATGKAGENEDWRNDVNWHHVASKRVFAGLTFWKDHSAFRSLWKFSCFVGPTTPQTLRTTLHSFSK